MPTFTHFTTFTILLPSHYKSPYPYFHFLIQTRTTMTILTLIILLSTLLVKSSDAQNAAQDYINNHNSARSAVGVGNMVWNTTLAAYAQTYANSRKGDCQLVHSNGPYGENLAKGNNGFTGTAAVKLWVDEKPYYSYNTNACAGGECLHYTQVVWQSSYRVGCARVQCNNGWWFVSCNYDPPGNWDGEWPY